MRLPETVLAKWKATGPGWQTRMADLLSKRAS
ncbi:MAG: BrnA antitoxin family protein [Rhodanobacter sp.]